MKRQSYISWLLVAFSFLLGLTSCTQTNPPAAKEKSADLIISKIVNVEQVTQDQSFSYTITVTNKGPDLAENVVVTDTLPEALSLLESDGCNEDPEAPKSEQFKLLVRC